MQISASLKFRVYDVYDKIAGVLLKLKTKTEDKGGGIMVTKVIQHNSAIRAICTVFTRDMTPIAILANHMMGIKL
jgi:hypothetical protein